MPITGTFDAEAYKRQVAERKQEPESPVFDFLGDYVDLSTVIPLAGQVLTGLAIILAASIFARIVRRALNRAMDGFEWAAQIGSLITTTAYYAILGGGVMTGVSTMGIDITPIIAALGLGGFALGFALRDAISNLLAGVLIIIYRPFTKGDHISVAGAEGMVDEINLRYTVLIGENGKALIPNQMIVSTTVKINNND